jgi:hypothetical protein
MNPCSRTAPCKTFAGAIFKTALNGEINRLDPDGFGAVTITKSNHRLSRDVRLDLPHSSTTMTTRIARIALNCSSFVAQILAAP